MSEPAPLTRGNSNGDVLRIELFIAQLLRWGVIFSFVIVAIGIGTAIVTDQTGYHQIRLDDVNTIVAYYAGQPEFPNSVSDILSGLWAFKPYAIISFGLFVLIAIPVMRVAVSVVAFALERDWLYVAITIFVFAMLMLSFAIGEGGG
jgi:uncharacterized membrane protein